MGQNQRKTGISRKSTQGNNPMVHLTKLQKPQRRGAIGQEFQAWCLQTYSRYVRSRTLSRHTTFHAEWHHCFRMLRTRRVTHPLCRWKKVNSPKWNLYIWVGMVYAHQVCETDSRLNNTFQQSCICRPAKPKLHYLRTERRVSLVSKKHESGYYLTAPSAIRTRNTARDVHTARKKSKDGFLERRFHSHGRICTLRQPLQQ